MEASPLSSQDPFRSLVHRWRSWMLLLLGLLATSCSSNGNGAKPDLGAVDLAVGQDSAHGDQQVPAGKNPLLLKNAHVITVNEAQPSAEAIYIVGDRIEAVGSTAEIEGTIDPETKVIDLQGKTVVPGFIDAHLHVLDVGRVQGYADLRQATTKSEVVQIVEQEVARLGTGQLVIGFGWDQNMWPVKEFPTKQDLDPVSPSNMVVLMRICGHALWVNSLVLNLLGINASTPDPPGGRFERDPVTGEPTGILHDAAMNAVFNLAGSTASKSDEILAADRLFSSVGLTTVGDAAIPYPADDGGQEIVKIYKDLIDKKQLKTRFSLAVSYPGDAAEAYLNQGAEIGYGDSHLSIRAIKLWADGTLGSRTAALFEDYSDDPGNKGELYLNDAEHSPVIDRALKQGFQVWVHAIGDRAVKTTLDLYEKALDSNPQVTNHRLRIEHSMVLRQLEIDRFSQLGVIPSIQPLWVLETSWAQDRLGPERIKLAYAWGSVLASGARAAGGSDAPNVTCNPLYGIHAGVTRQDLKGQPAEGWNPQEKITPMQALKLFTIDAAYALFEDEIKGSLEKGKLADLVVLSKDILSIPADQIPTTEVEMTVVGGEIVYEK